MSKILLATTSILAFSGAARAEVSITGTAEMGIIGGGDFVVYVPGYSYAFDQDAQFLQSIDVTFRMSTETDNGLNLGARIDLDDLADHVVSHDEDTVDVQDFADFSVWASGAFGALTLGDVDGAMDWALREAVLGSTINDVEEHIGWSGNSGLDGVYDGQVLRYNRSLGNVGLALSLELDDDGEYDPVYGIGANYSLNTEAGDFTFAVGYQEGDQNEFSSTTDRAWGVSVYADLFNGFEAVLNYSKTEGYQSWMEYSQEYLGLAVSYTFDAWTVAANWGRLEGENDWGDFNNEGYSLVLNYDLGGGAELQAGWGRGTIDEDSFEDDYSTWSLGVAMSF